MRYDHRLHDVDLNPAIRTITPCLWLGSLWPGSPWPGLERCRSLFRLLPGGPSTAGPRIGCWLASLLLAGLLSPMASAQQPAAAPPDEAGITQEELQQIASQAAIEGQSDEGRRGRGGLRSSLNFLSLLIEGGALMIPIGIMSLLVVTFALERWFALRRGRMFPRVLRREIRKASDVSDEFDPRTLFIVSEKYPSAASRILQDMLRKLGRPVPEAETAIAEGAQREADAMYSNVRWLTLAAAVTPLIGLLGTVWGMIIAFYNTTQLGVGSNKAEFLAEGIYVALVTTLGGLAVAIPAAIFAHYFEGRISRMLARVEDELRKLIPSFERLEGRARYDINSSGLVRREASECSSQPDQTSAARGKHGGLRPTPSPTTVQQTS